MAGVLVIGLAECRYGLLAHFTKDPWLGRSVRELGEWSEAEVALWRAFLRPGMTVVDVGANIGAHSVALARIVEATGKVWAFEPQRLVYEVLVTNKVLNRLWQLECRALALAHTTTAAWYTPPCYTEAMNTGGVMFQVDGGWSGDAEIAVEARALDELGLGHVDFVKIDVEGMERDVLIGARETLRRDRPILYVENDRYERQDALVAELEAQGYTLRWHLPPLDNPANFRGRIGPAFPGVCSSNLLCTPPGMEVLVPGLLAFDEAILTPEGTIDRVKAVT